MSMLEAALEWNERGFPVFPLIPNGKTPHPELSKNHEGQGGCYWATHDRTRIQWWWTRWPLANLGIACGRTPAGVGPLVLDIDNKHGKDGSGDLQAILSKHGTLPRLPMVLTPTGGYHLYSIYDTRMDDKRTGKFFGYDSIDVQGTGCYVVAPPSIIDGKHYVEEVDTGFDDVEMVSLPHWCFAGMTDKVELVAGVATSGKPLDVPSLALRRAMKMVLVAGDVLGQYPSTSEMVQALEKDLIRGGYGDADIVTLLMDSGHVGGVKAQTQGERWLLSDISRCRSIVAQDDTTPPVDDAPPWSDIPRMTSNGATPAPPSAWRPLLTAKDFLLAATEEMEWLIQGMVGKGTLSILAGPPKAGKSTFSRHLLMSVILGKDFLGRAACPGRVLLYSLEDPNNVSGKHLAQLGLQEDMPLWGRITRESADLVEIMRTDIASVAPDLIVVDTMNVALDMRDMNDIVETTKKLTPLRELTRETNTAIVLLGHTRKTSTGSGLDILGSTGLRAGADLNMIYHHDEETDTRFLRTEGRIGEHFTHAAIALDNGRCTLGKYAHLSDLDSAMIQTLIASPGGSLSHVQWLTACKLGTRKKREEAIAHLQRDGLVMGERGEKNSMNYTVFEVAFSC